jgi:hypothetical protein
MYKQNMKLFVLQLPITVGIQKGMDLSHLFLLEFIRQPLVHQFQQCPHYGLHIHSPTQAWVQPLICIHAQSCELFRVSQNKF